MSLPPSRTQPIRLSSDNETYYDYEISGILAIWLLGVAFLHRDMSVPLGMRGSDNPAADQDRRDGLPRRYAQTSLSVAETE